MPVSVLSCAVTGPGDAVDAWDPRARRGRRYPLLAVVRAAACAVAAGARSYAAIGQRLRRAPQHTLARMGFPARGALGVRSAPSKHTDRGRGHDRTETRLIQVLTVPHFAFPHVKQVARITRHRTNRATGKRTRETVYVITDLSSAQLKPEDLARAM